MSTPTNPTHLHHIDVQFPNGPGQQLQVDANSTFTFVETADRFVLSFTRAGYPASVELFKPVYWITRYTVEAPPQPALKTEDDLAREHQALEQQRRERVARYR
jgi:hypothetical protein